MGVPAPVEPEAGQRILHTTFIQVKIIVHVYTNMDKFEHKNQSHNFILPYSRARNIIFVGMDKAESSQTYSGNVTTTAGGNPRQSSDSVTEMEPQPPLPPLPPEVMLSSRYYTLVTVVRSILTCEWVQVISFI